MGFFQDNLILFLFLTLFILGFQRMFFNNRKAKIISISSVIVLGIILTFVFEQIRYTTFHEVFAEQLNEDTEVQEISISAYETINSSSERKRTAVIEEKEIIDVLINNFKELDLKKKTGLFFEEKYTIVITAKNQIGEKHFRTDNLYLRMNNDYINRYRVVDDIDHLEILTQLEENDAIEWVTEN